MASGFQHLNPDTPLAFIPEATANQFEISRYLLVATAGMFAWDILCNLRGDYRLLTEYRITLPTLVYFVSRISTFAYIISGMVFKTQGLPDCLAASRVPGWIFPVAAPATSLLIFFRVRAVFNSNKYVVALFASLWIGLIGGSLTVPFAIAGEPLGPTNHCIDTAVKPYASAGVIVFTINDTMAFIFISWRLLQSPGIEDSFKGQMKSFFSGKGLPAFSRAVLQSGQEYYLITVGWNILTMAMILAPASLPLYWHAMFTVPNIAIGNSMACRVFRYIKFGRISANAVTIRGTNTGASLPPFASDRKPSHKTFQTSFGPDMEDHLEGEPNGSIRGGGIHVEQTVEQYADSDIPMTIMFPPKSYSPDA